MSYVTDGSDHSDGELDIYVKSLSSQGAAMGFEAPLNQRRRGLFV
jgi:hypothetical protein